MPLTFLQFYGIMTLKLFSLIVTIISFDDQYDIYFIFSNAKLEDVELLPEKLDPRDSRLSDRSRSHDGLADGPAVSAEIFPSVTGAAKVVSLLFGCELCKLGVPVAPSSFSVGITLSSSLSSMLKRQLSVFKCEKDAFFVHWNNFQVKKYGL